MTAGFRIEALAPVHDRRLFSSGVPPLDQYLKTRATQDEHRGFTSCYVAVEIAEGAIAGFYTLAAADVPIDSLPPDLSRKLPRYPNVPAILIGRLAVDLRWQGQGVGSAMVADAVRRSAALGVGVYAIVVDAKDDGAARFYEHLGFVRLIPDPRTLALPMATGKALFL